MTIEKGVLWFHDLASRGTGQNRVALASSWLSAITISGLVQGSKSIGLLAFFKVASKSKVLQPMYTQVVLHMATMVESCLGASTQGKTKKKGEHFSMALNELAGLER